MRLRGALSLFLVLPSVCLSAFLYVCNKYTCLYVSLSMFLNKSYGIQHLGAIHVEVQFVLLSIIEVSTASETLKLQVRMHVYMLSHFYAR